MHVDLFEILRCPYCGGRLELVTSIFNGYLNNRFVDLIENNVGRLEYMRTCKEILDAYFQIKVKAGGLSAIGDARRRGQGKTIPLREQLGADRGGTGFRVLPKPSWCCAIGRSI